MTDKEIDKKAIRKDYEALLDNLISWTGGTKGFNLESFVKNNIQEISKKNDVIEASKKQVTKEIITNSYYLSDDRKGVWSEYFRANTFSDFVTIARRCLMMLYTDNSKKFVLAIHPETVIKIDLEKLKLEVEKFTSKESEISVEVVISSDLPVYSHHLEGWMIRAGFKKKSSEVEK